MNSFHLLALVTLAVTFALGISPAHAQRIASTETGNVALFGLPDGFDGAAPPELPATVSRDANGQTTVRAVRLSDPLRIDGSLDEEIYQRVTPISDFIQAEPNVGAAATEKTEVWMSFDEDNIYVSVRASESQPERMIVNEMRRDASNIYQNENFEFVFDTFYDRRNAVAFQFNPIGGRMDGQISNESQWNGDWNPVWRLSVHRVDGGWTAEAAVPFKSLRYKPGTTQVWGILLRRINRWKNEVSYVTRLPDGVGSIGHFRVSRFATLVGLEAPSSARPLDVKPYVTSNVTSDLTTTPQVRNDLGGDFGLDAKYGITQNISADFTYKTDFAQVEADEQQVNLTRFSLYFPEKREFFLENQGLFQFATTGGNTNTNTTTSNYDVPTLFYSRRIGLDDGHQVPLDVGGRVTGQIGPYSIGLLNIQTGDVDTVGLQSTNYAVARIRRDFLRRSTVGAIYTRRSVATNMLGDAHAYGVDSTLAFFQNLYINTYWAGTQTPGVDDNNTSYRGQVNYVGDRYGFQAERLQVDDQFDPQIGFIQRDNFTKTRTMFRFSPRPQKRFRAVRKFTYQAWINLFENDRGQLETRQRNLEFNAEFQNSDKLIVEYESKYELLTSPFAIASGVTVPVGGYDVSNFAVEFDVGQQRRAAGNWLFETGPFYDGRRVALGYSSARVNVSQRVSVEPGFSVNRVTLPYGDFTAKLASARTTFTMTPLMFVSALLQYNSSNNSLGTNIRFRWEYQPGSELFVVYNDSRDTLPRGAPVLQNRALIFKVNRLFRF